MSYHEFRLGYQDRSSVVEISLSGVESDVFLVDSANLSAFERGLQFSYYGGHYKASPVLLGVPASAFGR